MKKAIFLYTTFLFLLIFNLANASPLLKGTFSGKVKDKATGRPVAGASVMIADIKAGSTTNASGEFVIEHISEGVHLIEISHIGYTTIAENLDIKGDIRKEYLLEESIVENNAVIITGVSKATQLRKVPFQVSVMRREELTQTASTNIIESITKKAGVSSLSTGPAISKPLIRGLGYNRVLTINDGVRQEGQQWGDEHGIEIDEASVNKIEVLKGPASLVYGSDAMAGVINIITNVPVQANTIQANAGTNFQTNNRLRSLFGNAAGNHNGFNWNVYGTLKVAADYKNKYDGYVFNSKFNEQNMGGYAGYNGNWGYSHLLFSSFNLKAGLVEGERDSEGYFVKPVAGGALIRATEDDFKSTSPQFPYQHIRHMKAASDNNFKIGMNRLSLNVAWQRNRREEFGNPDNINERSLYFDLATITYNTRFHFRESGGWKNSFGINGMSQQNTNRGAEQLIPDYTLLDIGGFFFSQKEFKNITFSGGARFDTRKITAEKLQVAGVVKGDAFARSFSNFSGSLGLAYQAGKSVNLKLNLARAFRAPGIPELSSNGAHEGTIRYEYGDKDLTSEISTQADAAIEYNGEHVSVNLAGYFNQFNNFIFYRKLSAVSGGDSTVTVDGNELTAFKFDQQKASLAGMEVTLDIHPHPLHWLHVENTFSLVAGRLKNAVEGSKNLPFIPAPKLLSEVRADIKKLGKTVRNFYAKLEIENTFRQNNPFTAFNTETMTRAYTLVNAGVGSTFYSKKNMVLFGVNISALNIGDIAYQSHLNRLKYAAENMSTGRTGVFNMGRNFSVRVEVPLSFRLK